MEQVAAEENMATTPEKGTSDLPEGRAAVTSGKNGTIDYDEILEHIGQFGKFQMMVHFLLWFFSAFAGCILVVFVFVGFSMNYRCAVPYCEPELADASYQDESGNFPDYVIQAIPNASLAKSSMCQFNSPKNPGAISSCDEYLNALSTGDVEIETCQQDRLVFDKSVVQDSIVSSFGLTCDKFYAQGLIGPMFMVGILVGSLLLGHVSDKYGRMKGLMLSLTLGVTSGSLAAVIPDPTVFAILRIINGFGTIGTFMCSFVLSVEYVGYKYTVLLGILIELPFPLGEMLLGMEAYYIRDWVTLQLVSHLPWLVLLLLWFVIPESPRWLISQGRIDEAVQVIRKAAKFNGATVPEELLEPREPLIPLATAEEEQQLSEATAALPRFLDIFRPRVILLRSLNMFYQWFAVNLCYFGLSYASTSLRGDPYSNFLMNVAIEIPGYLFCLFVMDCWGRRPILSFCQVVAGASCIIAGFLYDQIDDNASLIPVQIFFSLIGKFMASAAFGIVYIYTAELYPTAIRNTAIGACGCFARVGGVIALGLQLLANYYLPAPMILMGSAALVAGVLGFYFPETVGRPLPTTMKQAIEIGDGNERTFCTCTCPATFKSARTAVGGNPQTVQA